MKNGYELNLIWLYPKEMSTYGDRGNIIALKNRGEWRDIKVNLMPIGLREEIPAEADIFFFGGGQDISQVTVATDLKKYKKVSLTEQAQKGKVFLGICGGYQLFGHYYQDGFGNDMEGLGILDVTTKAGKERMMGNLVVESVLVKEKLIGFENHSGKTYLGSKANPLGKVLVGQGNNGEDRTEGAVQNSIFGCYLHGPLLPKNPEFADYLLKLALKNKYGDLELKFINDNQEHLAHESALKRAVKTR